MIFACIIISINYKFINNQNEFISITIEIASIINQKHWRDEVKAIRRPHNLISAEYA